MIKKIAITHPVHAQEVLHIQLPAYQIEASLIGFGALPPLFDTTETLQTSGETFYGFYTEDELCGVISWKIADRIMDIHRLFVNPVHFQKGIGGALLQWAIHSASGLDRMQVSTGTDNLPAIRFYQKFGFTISGMNTVPEGLSISTLHKKIRKKEHGI